MQFAFILFPDERVTVAGHEVERADGEFTLIDMVPAKPARL